MPAISITSLNTLIENLEEGILFLDKDRRVVAINQAAINMIGDDHHKLLDSLCPSLFQGTECARSCEQRGYCSLMSSKAQKKKVQDIELARPDNSSVSLRMWALTLPSTEPVANCAVVLRNRTRERQLEEQVSERLRLGGLIGHSRAMQDLFRQILRAAASEASVLIEGESGVGKELVARALHENSSRAKGSYVRVHCAALAENLLESELFGHTKGAFTGATSARAGRFEAADGGTILLDEIGEISPTIQVKLLRVLQEREVERLGENVPRKVDVRIIAATHRDLGAMVRAGTFREDLYYRLRVLPIRVPSLRERREDVGLLVNHLLGEMVRRYKREEAQVSDEMLRVLEAYDWPGNVRELVNALEYAMVQTDSATLLPHHLPPEIRAVSAKVALRPVTIQEPSAPVRLTRYYQGPTGDEEKAAIVRALEEAGGNRSLAADRLGMSRTTLWKRLKEYGL